MLVRKLLLAQQSRRNLLQQGIFPDKYLGMQPIALQGRNQANIVLM